jgi:hypothetical protein
MDDSDDWSEEIRRGAAAKQELLQLAGPGLTADQLASRLGLNSAAKLLARISNQTFLAVPTERGEMIFPARQFRPPSYEVRRGLPAVLKAAGAVDPWVILSLLVGPNLLSGSGTALDGLDDPEVTSAVVELVSSYGHQGAV